MQEGRLLSAVAATSARGGRGGGGGLCVMRIKRLSPEERERAVADKEINEKKVGERPTGRQADQTDLERQPRPSPPIMH